MTIPTERYNSLVKTKEFLEEMLKHPHAYSSEEISQMAYTCLRHYPYDYHLDTLADNSPEILEKP